jgi:hypothetical protein
LPFVAFTLQKLGFGSYKLTQPSKPILSLSLSLSLSCLCHNHNQLCVFVVETQPKSTSQTKPKQTKTKRKILSSNHHFLLYTLFYLFILLSSLFWSLLYTIWWFKAFSIKPLTIASLIGFEKLQRSPLVASLARGSPNANDFMRIPSIDWKYQSGVTLKQNPTPNRPQINTQSFDQFCQNQKSYQSINHSKETNQIETKSKANQSRLS